MKFSNSAKFQGGPKPKELPQLLPAGEYMTTPSGGKYKKIEYEVVDDSKLPKNDPKDSSEKVCYVRKRVMFNVKCTKISCKHENQSILLSFIATLFSLCSLLDLTRKAFVTARSGGFLLLIG